MSKAPRKTYVILDHANKLADRENLNPNRQVRLQRSRLDAENADIPVEEQDDAAAQRTLLDDD